MQLFHGSSQIKDIFYGNSPVNEIYHFNTLVYSRSIKLIIQPTPSDATVTLQCTGYTQVGNSITVNYNSSINYTVTKSGYVTQTGTIVLTNNQTLPISLIGQYTFTVTPTPSDSTVTLTASGFSQVGNSIMVDPGTSVTYSVSRTGYNTSSNTVTVNSTQNLSVSLTKKNYTLTVNKPTSPNDATITFNTTGTVSGNSITVPYDTTVSYNVSRTGYVTKSNQTYRVTQNATITAPNLDKQNYTLTISTDGSVTFNTGTISGKTCTVPYNTSVTYTVTKRGYVSVTNTVTVTSNQTISVSLTAALPVNETAPATSKTLLESTSGAQYKTYTITADGWYYVEVMGGGSGYSNDGRLSTQGGGLTSKAIFMFKGSVCLLWSGSKSINTGYPEPTDYWGGCGGMGHDESGGGGGGAANNGRNKVHNDAAHGAGGSGFLVGNPNATQVSTMTNSNWSRNFTSSGTFSVSGINLGHLYAAVLCGGSGGSTGNNGDNRTAGGGGGAYGSGGPSTNWPQYAPTTGPGGSWGVGQGGDRYGFNGGGAWCYIDLSTNTSAWGQKGGTSNSDGYCKLYKFN